MSYRILLIDDRHIVMDGIKNALLIKEPIQVDIETANNFFQAISCLSSRTYDLISLDLNMPSIADADCFGELSGTTLNGWLFLKHYIFSENAQFKAKCIKSKIVIFSGFIDELRNHIKSLSPEQTTEEQWFKGVTLIHKGNGEYDTLANTILSLLNQKN